MTRYTLLLQEKAQFCAVRDKRDPFSCSNGAGKLACVSPEERAWKDVSFFESAHLSKI